MGQPASDYIVCAHPIEREAWKRYRVIGGCSTRQQVLREVEAAYPEQAPRFRRRIATRNIELRFDAADERERLLKRRRAFWQGVENGTTAALTTDEAKDEGAPGGRWGGHVAASPSVARRERESPRERPTEGHVCEDCGTSLAGYGANKRYCEEHRLARRRASNADSIRQRRNREPLREAA